MGLREIESKLPPGFRFYPSDEELVCHYLCKKICRERVWEGTLVEVDLHTCEPWELPEVARLSANEWYFFSFRDRKYSTGSRTNRATKTGYWKATGKDRSVQDPNTHAVVGMRKTLVFYSGRAPNGIKTGWVMHEFRLEAPHVPPKEGWVLCRVFSKKKGESTATSVPDDEQEDGYVGYSSPFIDDFSSAIQLDDDHQLPTFATPFPTTQPEDPHMPRLQHDYHLHVPAAQEVQCYDDCFAGFGGPPRPEDDGYGFLVGMGMGEHGAAAGPSSGHGMGSC